MMEHVGFLTSEQVRSAKNVGSSTIRAKWIVNHWPDAELYRMGHRYTTVIFQKAYWIEYAERFTGVKILDICDPDFLHWNSACMKMVEVCDAVTTSSTTLADTVRSYTTKPVVCIPDRLDFDQFPQPLKEHAGNGSARTAAWYGYSVNYPSLDKAYPALKACGIERLLVISDRNKPYKAPIEDDQTIEIINYPWTESTVYSQLCEADLVLNFTLEHGRWRYKSNNKSLVAWALGLPVAHGNEELAALTEEEARIRHAAMAHKRVREEFDVRRSVQEFKELIAQIRS